ncbi:MAG: transglutaminase-like domain-containing protein, partial [candidate division Zixibacteria bacterium]|nr:transglutaminase-like domain-containing protein [candidate division Zixibacteria bacterium]
MSLRKCMGMLLLVAVLAGCGAQYPADVSQVLVEAGQNRAELEKVLNRFSESGDSLKLKAAYYLIGNMSGHCYATYRLADTAGQEIPFNVLDFATFDDLTKGFDSLERVHGTLEFEKGERVNDIEVITADFLVGQIDCAFRAWREKPWAQKYSFDDFCSYILPYRGSNEPLEDWRTPLWDKYAYVPGQMRDSTDPLEAVGIINTDVRSWFTFDSRFYYHPTDQGLSEMQSGGLGRCEDMTNASIYCMRANGLPITSDYTPYWADCGNNHAWNAVVTPDGKAIPFMGAEADPGNYGLFHKAAKIYRKMFGKSPGNLAFQTHKQDSVPRWLAGKSYRDVTAEYFDVCDVTVRLDRAVPDSVDIAYLCVFNTGEWKPIHWGRIDHDSVTFTDMGPDIVYLPALYLNEEVVPWGVPFILGETDCSILALAPQTDTETGVLVDVT